MSSNRFGRILRKVFFRKKYKDTLFQRVFSDKKHLLALYNALNGTDYKDEENLEITTLEDAIYISRKNDVSFILASTLNLYEHQSTINENMPIRGLLYFAKQYEAYIKLYNLDIYQRKMIKLPLPQYVVFYNGREDQPDEKILKLSDAYEPVHLDEKPMLECVCRVLNINYGHNKTIMDTCQRLKEYSYFVNEVYKNVDSGLKIKEAINVAVDDCIENDVLRDVLLKHKAEVFGMLLFTYDEKLHKKTIRDEAIQEGLQEGRREGLQEGRLEGLQEGRLEGRLEGRREGIQDTIYKYVSKGNVSLEDGANDLGISVESLMKQMEAAGYRLPEK